MARPDESLPLLDFLTAACNNYVRHCYPDLEFKSQQHRDIIKIWFAGAFEAYIHSGDAARIGVIMGAMKVMHDFNWWPDERFRF